MKILQWLLKLAVTAAVTSVCCMVLTFAAVNTYVNMLLDQYHIQRPAGQQLGWGPFLSAMTRQIGGLAAADGSGSGTAAGTGAGAGSGAGAGGGKDLAVSAGGSALTDNGTPEPKSGQTSSPGGSSGTPNSGTKPDTDRKPPDDAVAVWSRQSSSSASSSGSASDDQKIVVSGEDFTKRKEQLSSENKAKIFSMLTTRVPEAEIQKISMLMEDGLTAAELKEVEQILQKYLKPDEYAQLLAMVKGQ